MPTPLVTIFAKDLQKNLYPNNEFYKNSKDDSSMIEGEKVVLAQSGAPPSHVKNPTNFPLPLSSKDDSANEYPLDLIATIPTHIRFDEDIVVNYAKRESILEDHKNVINTGTAEAILDSWAPAGSEFFVRTTGANTGSLSPGATGTRKRLTKDNWIDAVTLLDNMDVPDTDRFALVSANQYGELLKVEDFVDYQKRGLVDLISKGWIGELCGVKIYKRSRAGLYSNAGTPVYKPTGSPVGTTDNQAIIFWQRDQVRRAEGQVQIFIKESDPQLLGGALNAAVRAGGRKGRSDGKGVVAIVQAHG